jgi:hypothetical protein
MAKRSSRTGGMTRPARTAHARKGAAATDARTATRDARADQSALELCRIGQPESVTSTGNDRLGGAWIG